MASNQTGIVNTHVCVCPATRTPSLILIDENGPGLGSFARHPDLVILLHFHVVSLQYWYPLIHQS